MSGALPRAAEEGAGDSGSGAGAGAGDAAGLRNGEVMRGVGAPSCGAAVGVDAAEKGVATAAAVAARLGAASSDVAACAAKRVASATRYSVRSLAGAGPEACSAVTTKSSSLPPEEREKWKRGVRSAPTRARLASALATAPSSAGGAAAPAACAGAKVTASAVRTSTSAAAASASTVTRVPRLLPDWQTRRCWALCRMTTPRSTFGTGHAVPTSSGAPPSPAADAGARTTTSSPRERALACRSPSARPTYGKARCGEYGKAEVRLPASTRPTTAALGGRLLVGVDPAVREPGGESPGEAARAGDGVAPPALFFFFPMARPRPPPASSGGGRVHRGSGEREGGGRCARSGIGGGIGDRGSGIAGGVAAPRPLRSCATRRFAKGKAEGRVHGLWLVARAAGPIPTFLHSRVD